MNELHLFAGAGGGILAGQLLGHRCVCAVEWEPYAQAVLVARQNDGTFCLATPSRKSSSRQTLKLISEIQLITGLSKSTNPPPSMTTNRSQP